MDALNVIPMHADCSRDAVVSMMLVVHAYLQVGSLVTT